MTRKSGAPDPPWFEDDKAVFTLECFMYLLKKKSADHNQTTGQTTEWKVVEVSDRLGVITARIQRLTQRGGAR